MNTKITFADGSINEFGYCGCGISSGLNIYNPSDLHSYVYVRNNPVNYTDPTGTGFIRDFCVTCCMAKMKVCTSWATCQPNSEAAMRACNTSLTLCIEYCDLGGWWCSKFTFPHE